MRKSLLAQKVHTGLSDKAGCYTLLQRIMNAKEAMAKPIIITTKRISITYSSKRHPPYRMGGCLAFCKKKPENAFSGTFPQDRLTRLVALAMALAKGGQTIALWLIGSQTTVF